MNSPEPARTGTDGRILLITLLDSKAAPGGRQLLYRMNHAILADLFGDRLLLFRPCRHSPRSIMSMFKGHIDGIDGNTIAEISALVRDRGVSRIFLDGSNFGAVARVIRRRHPQTRVITFFHNVEARFFLGALRARRTLRAAAVLIANYLAEQAAVRNSDMLLCLSVRDGTALKRLYGRMPDAITPLAMMDPRSSETPHPADGGSRYLLFVGGGFYANIAGIEWFAREVVPRLSIPTVIIGRGLEALATDFAGNEMIRWIGPVDDLSPWYHGALAVIAPIFDGSGMKTKVAEAMMFGKRVIGTPEAFSGYDDAVVASGWRCHGADDFVHAIEEAVRLAPPAFDAEARSLYDRFHSFAAARERMARILEVSA